MTQGKLQEALNHSHTETALTPQSAAKATLPSQKIKFPSEIDSLTIDAASRC